MLPEDSTVNPTTHAHFYDPPILSILQYPSLRFCRRKWLVSLLGFPIRPKRFRSCNYNGGRKENGTHHLVTRLPCLSLYAQIHVFTHTCTIHMLTLDFALNFCRRRLMRASTTGSLSWWRAGNSPWGTKPCSRPSETPKVVHFRFLGTCAFCLVISVFFVFLFSFCVIESWCVVIAGKLIIISNNCPPLRKSEIEYYAMLSKVGVHHYNGSKFLIS